MKFTIIFTLLRAVIALSEPALLIQKPVGPAPAVPKPGVSSKACEAIDTLLELLDAYNNIRDFIEAVQNIDDSNAQCAQLETRTRNCLHPNSPSATEANVAEATARICELRSTMWLTQLPGTGGDVFSKCGSILVNKYESACPTSKVARTAAQEQSAEDSSSDWTNFNESKAGSSDRTGSSGSRTHGGDPANGAGYKAGFPCELLGTMSLIVTLFVPVFL